MTGFLITRLKNLCHVEDCEYIIIDLYKLEVYLFESETITAS